VRRLSGNEMLSGTISSEDLPEVEYPCSEVVVGVVVLSDIDEA
jgi:hypothetical protein